MTYRTEVYKTIKFIEANIILQEHNNFSFISSVE
jgi:hypothetical protein